MKKIVNGAQVITQSLEDLGITHVFGYSGAAILPLFDAIGQSGNIKIIINSNEQSAAFSATGYSRSSNQIGVVIVSSGPAITNTLTAVADAFSDSIPLIVISGQVPEHKLGTDSFQHIDVEKVFGPTAKKVVTVDKAEKLEEIVKDAYYLAKSGKPGPVLIDIPVNLLQQECRYQNNSLLNHEKVHEDFFHLSDELCKSFFDLLKHSKRPLLYIGGGLNTSEGSAAIRAFNDLFNIPSVNTLMAKGVVDENGPFAMGLLGMFGTPYANKIIQENDFFFAMGVRWDDRVAEKVGFAIHAKIAYIDINATKVKQIRNERNPDFTYIGDVAATLRDLTDYAIRHEIRIDIGNWQNRSRNLKQTWPLNYNKTTQAIQQAEVLELLNTLKNDNMIFTTGVGNHQLFAAQYLKMDKVKSFLTSGSFGTMGFGIPNAIGAYFANPDANVIAIDGDGSLRMNMGELHTIGSQNLPIKIVLLNNRVDGMVNNLEDVAFGSRHYVTQRSGDINFSQLAEKCNFHYTKRVVNREMLLDTLQEFIALKSNAFLEIMTDKKEVLYPVVRAGKSYSEMELGPYIKEIKLI